MRKIIFFGAIALIAVLLLSFFIAILVGSAIGKGLSMQKEIAVIPITGEISSASNSFSTALSSSEIADKIEGAEDDPRIGAILLDIDSGGGAVVATKNIVAKIRSAKKPTVAYINDIGASGAYYVASATSYIIADEDSLTGSIGVLSIIENYQGLLEKIGVDVNVLRAGENKAMANPFEEITEEQKQMLQSILDESFSHFKRDIMEYRSGKLDYRLFSEISDGRILSGTQALKIGLIDKTGTRQDAIDKAAELAGISGKPVLRAYSKKDFSFSDLFANAGYSFGFGFKKGMISFEQGLKAQ